MGERPDDRVYRLIGEEGFTRLIAEFYGQISNDDILGPMYPSEDLAGAEKRLRDFLIFRFGGPPRYIAERGHPRLRMRHAPFRINRAGRDRWMALMEKALEAARLPEEAETILRDFFEEGATFMINSS